MRKSIGRTLIVGLILLTVLMTVSACVVVSRRIDRLTIEKYDYVGQSLTGSLADMIDGDRAVAYLETGERDDYYDEVLTLLRTLSDRFESESLYVGVPKDGQFHYIWSDDDEDEDTLGYTEPFDEDMGRWMSARLSGSDEEPLWLLDHPEYGRLAIAGSAVYNAAGEAVAIVLSDFSLKEIEQIVLNLNLRISFSIVLLMSAFIAAYSLYVNRNLTRPIRKLAGAAESMAENMQEDVAYHSDIHTGNELETLSRSFEKMDEDLRRYIADNLRISAERQRLGAELDLAASIQSGQLPQTFPAFPDRRDFDIYATMTPAKSVGGDFYDFFMVDDDHIALVMADVSGKGVPAALFMMMSRVRIKTRVQAGESPALALAGVNRQLMENNQAELFVTVWLAVVELSTGKGLAANAGHEHPALCRRGGRYELVKYRHASPVAILSSAKFAEHEFRLDPGDSVFVYTDGVVEATNRNEALFGDERMLEALNRQPDAGCKETLRNVMDGIEAFVDGAEQFDDITMMCFTYYGAADGKEVRKAD